MRRFILSSLVLLATLAATAATAHAQAAPSHDDQIRSALSAAPAAVAEHATVALMDGTILRQGSSDWVCMPDMPDVPGNSPMCLDANWREVMDALMNQRDPAFVGTGFSYMLQGDMPVSNTDPFATGPTQDNEWIPSGGPHIMVVFSDHAMLEGISTDPDSGGPFVMWKGTPYAHVMIPTEPRRP
ncbi:MAG: hypothetical protein ACN0LA_12415 [Candidatus Longimicrobiales bacterium M2_2A_002]